MNLIKLMCVKSKFSGDLCDFRSGNQYSGIYIDNTLMVDGNHGDIHFFTEKGMGYFEELPTAGICYCGDKVTVDMEDTIFTSNDLGNTILIHVDCGYEQSLERHFHI